MRTIKIHSNYALSLLLILTVLVMPWATAHIHLSEHHKHDGVEHQHHVEVHTHDLIQQDIASINFSHQEHHAIALEYNYNLPKKEKPKSPSAALISSAFHFPPTFFLSNLKISALISAKLSYFERSTVNPRAPPQTC